MSETDWTKALCKGLDQDIFYEPRFENQAVAICQNCPLRNPCLAEAINTNQTWGVWGGLTFSDRKMLKLRLEGK